jgi:hypothetical protein
MVPATVLATRISKKRVSESAQTGKILRWMEYIPMVENSTLAQMRYLKRPEFIPSVPWFATASILLVACFSPVRLQGQAVPFAFQIRGGATAAVGGFLNEDEGWEEKAGPGRSFGMGFTFPLFRMVGGYLGFSQHKFSCDEDVCPEGEGWLTTGFDVALRYVVGRGEIRPWVQAGLHTHRLEAKVFEEVGVRTLHSDEAGGFEVGGGVLIEMGERTSLSPGLRYGRGTVPFSWRPNMKLEYLVADLGLVVGF